MKKTFLVAIFIGLSSFVMSQSLSFDTLLKLYWCKDYSSFNTLISKTGFSTLTSKDSIEGVYQLHKYQFKADKSSFTFSDGTTSSNICSFTIERGEKEGKQWELYTLDIITSDKDYYLSLLDQIKQENFKPGYTNNLTDIDGICTQYNSESPNSPKVSLFVKTIYTKDEHGSNTLYAVSIVGAHFR